MAVMKITSPKNYEPKPLTMETLKAVAAQLGLGDEK